MASYDINNDSKLNGAIRYSRIENSGVISVEEREVSSGLSSHTVDQGRVATWTLSSTAGYVRKLGADDHTIAIDLRRDESETRSRDSIVQSFGNVQNGFHRFDIQRDTVLSGLKAEYKRPLGPSKLTAGLQYDLDEKDFSNVIFDGPTEAGATLNPLLSGAHDYTQSIAATYATYQLAWGKTKVMPGLRVEGVNFEIIARHLPFRREDSYVEFYPSFHLEHDLGSGKTITASYTRRVQRPTSLDLQPGRFLTETLDYQDGNPPRPAARTSTWTRPSARKSAAVTRS